MTNDSSFPSRRFLLIGGASKAGTTSLFKYLADHPEVSRSLMKETRFFLDDDYPLPSMVRYAGSIDLYEEYFDREDAATKSLLVESTPDYLYQRTALQVSQLLPNARMVFVLRDPIDRLVSWFKYSKQRGMIGKTMTFDTYVSTQLEKVVNSDTPVHLRALEQGRYSRYVHRFEEAFGDRVMLVSFAEFQSEPTAVMQKICKFAGISAEYYLSYKFDVLNESRRTRYHAIESAYNTARRTLEYRMMSHPKTTMCLKRLNQLIKPALALNYAAPEAVAISPPVMKCLVEYYSSENADVLPVLFGEAPHDSA